MSNSRDWDTTDRFTDAKGKMLARILCWDDDGVRMERWPAKGGRKTRFTLPEKFFLCRSCGWRKVPTVGPGADARGGM